MNIDELLDKYTSLLESGDDTPSNMEPTIDEFHGSAFGDMAESWEPRMESLEPVMEPTLHPRRRLPYRPKILMSRCSFFPSFVDEEFEMEESQEQLLITDESYVMIPEMTVNTMQSKEVVDENPLLPNAQDFDYLLQRIFIGVSFSYEHNTFSWAPIGFLLQMFNRIGPTPQVLVLFAGPNHENDNPYFAHFGEGQNKIFDLGT